MIDLLHLPEPDERTVWFPGQGVSSSAVNWRVWTKPRGISMVSIIAIGAGCGGGGGAGNISGSTAGGGSGGGGGLMVKMLFNAWALPDRLYVISMAGGLGGDGGPSGSSGSPGNLGGASRVAVYPVLNTGNYLVMTGNNSGGNAGTTSSGGAAVNAFAPQIAANNPLGQMAATHFFVGAPASGAGSTASASFSSVNTNSVLSGSGGGGKTTGAGGTGAGYNATSLTLLNAVPGGTADTGEDASSGFIHAGIHYGGCGGGGNNLGVGGRGGNGVAWGAGGGGGGGGLTGGRGGDGGPGLVIIASW